MSNPSMTSKQSNLPKISQLLSTDAAIDSNSLELYDDIIKKLMYYMNPEHPLNIKALNDFTEILRNQNQDPEAILKHFRANNSHLLYTASDLKQLYKDRPTYQVEYKVKSAKLSKRADNKRYTTEPKLSITQKSVLRPMNKEECYSQKECQLYENFQLLVFYLSQVLYSIIPFMQDITKLRVAESGRFSYVEDPIEALRWDQMIRHMNESSYPEMKILVLKFISYRFQNYSEEQFIDIVNSPEISEFLENQELGIMLKKYIDDIKSLSTMVSQKSLISDQDQNIRQSQDQDQIDTSRSVNINSNINKQRDQMSQYATELKFISNNLDSIINERFIKKNDNSGNSMTSEESINLDFIVESDEKSEENRKRSSLGKDYERSKHELLLSLREKRDQLKQEIQELIEQ